MSTFNETVWFSPFCEKLKVNVPARVFTPVLAKAYFTENKETLVFNRNPSILANLARFSKMSYHFSF